MLRRMLTVGLKVTLVASLVAIVVQALQRRGSVGPQAPSPAWPPLEVDATQAGPVPATAEPQLTASAEEVEQATLATEHEATDLQQRLATAPTEVSAGNATLAEADHAVSDDVPPATDQAWIEPDAGGCPASHPLKAKLRSRVFHAPGMAHYDRTNADRCYRDAGAAEADGFRRAKR